MSRKIGLLALIIAALATGCADSPLAPNTGTGAGPGSGGGIPGPGPTPPVEEKTVAWIQITPAGGTLPQAPGTSRQLGVIARALDGTEIVGRPVQWSSGNPAVASVSATGFLQAHSVGTAWIVAVVDNRRDSTLVSVPSLIARVGMNPTELALDIGAEGTITATAFDAQGTTLTRSFTWSSSNVAVATVDATGRIVAVGAGTVLITATSEGKSGSTRVTVTGQQWRLTDVANAPLPAILYVDTNAVGGVQREVRFQAVTGTLRMVGSRYELEVEGWLLVEGAAPVLARHSSAGVVAYDVFSGAPMLFEGDEWANKTPRFRTRLRANGAIEVDWSRQPGEPVVAIGFTQ